MPGVERHRPLVALQPLTTMAVSLIEHWFDHPEFQQWLGDRAWIHRELRLIGERPGGEFRGMKVLRSHGWIAVDQTGSPAAFIGGDVYDRWVAHPGEEPGNAHTAGADPRTSMALVYAVDPSRWRAGYGRAALAAVLAHDVLSDVEAFYCGIAAENQPSSRCALGAGFHAIRAEPDSEGIIYYRHGRAPRR